MDIDVLLEELQEFQKKSERETCPVLEQFICHIAKTGQTLIPWLHFKAYFMFRLEKVMDDFHASSLKPEVQDNPNMEHVSFAEMKRRILNMVEGYSGIPFTIQRLCELLIEPKRHYTVTDKFLRGIEKNVMVVSCVCPSAEKNGSVSRAKGVLLPGNTPFYTYNRAVTASELLRLPNRTKLSLSTSFKGLPDCSAYKGIEQRPEEMALQDNGRDSKLSEIILNKGMKNKPHEEEEEDDCEPSKNKRVRLDEKESDISRNEDEDVSSCCESSESPDSSKDSELTETSPDFLVIHHDKVESAPSEKSMNSEEDTEMLLKDTHAPVLSSSFISTREGAADRSSERV
ncbi:serine/threonine-protein phosphatase 4 regulatory subunit 2-like isoform 1-T1 [Synchiropus picturatus]